MFLPRTASLLSHRTTEVVREPAGDLLALSLAHITGHGPPGLVVLGTFGTGKTTLCQKLVERSETPVTAVPLRVVAREPDLNRGLLRVVGATRLRQARAGERVLLLDGFDEVPRPPEGPVAWLTDLLSRVGPRWLLTSRPGYFRTESTEPDPDQVDLLADPSVTLAVIEPLSHPQVRASVGTAPRGRELLDSVDGLAELATSPILLHAVHAALPFIEPGRPIQPWGLFDAWIRHALSTGPGHSEAVAALEELAWSSFLAHHHPEEGASLTPERVRRAALPASLRRALLVTDLDGLLHFGHRTLYEHLVASVLARHLSARHGDPAPDHLTGRRITEAMRSFLVGRVAPPPVVLEAHRARIPPGPFIAGGDHAPDERPLRVAHLTHALWIAREPVTHREWAAHLDRHPDDRVDANYLPHWGAARSMPEHLADAPVYGILPADADAYAARQGARLPTADEWERAVRGVDGRRWPWGDRFRSDRAQTAATHLDYPLPARALGATGAAGLYAAVGGVFELTSSRWRDRDNRGRVVMGGGWSHPSATARPSLRLSHKLSGHLQVGLRLAWDANPESTDGS